MTYRGHVKNGVVVLDDAVTLPEGAEVQVAVVHLSKPEPDRDHGATLYERLKPVIGIAQGLPPDASLNVDHYLYGHPKK